MAIANGELVISAGCFQRPAGGAADLAKGTLVPDGVNVGVFLEDTPGNGTVVWANGRSQAEAFSSAQLRKVTPYSGTDMFGLRVSLAGAAPEFIGVVVQQFNTELSAVDGAGVQVPVCVVKTPLFTYIAEPSSLEEV